MTKIRNIGKVSRQWLWEIEIYTLQDLQACGSVAAFKMVRARYPHVSVNLLWALEGAISDLDWRKIPPDRKADLQRQLR